MDYRGHVHRKNWDVLWDAHHLTFSCFHDQRFFPGRYAAGWFLECLADARREAPFDLWAWVIMPEHVHLVIWPHEGVLMREIRWNMKKPLTDRVVAHVRCHAPSFLSRMADVKGGRTVYRFWQPGGGYDRNLRSVHDIHEKIGYIHDNPVRRGLVKRPEDWLWSSAADWLGVRKGPISLDLDSLPPAELR